MPWNRLYIMFPVRDLEPEWEALPIVIGLIGHGTWRIHHAGRPLDGLLRSPAPQNRKGADVRPKKSDTFSNRTLLTDVYFFLRRSQATTSRRRCYP